MVIADDRQLDSGSPEMSSERHIALRHPRALLPLLPLVFLISGCVTYETTAPDQAMLEIAVAPDMPPEIVPPPEPARAPPPEQTAPVKPSPRAQRPAPPPQSRPRASREAATPIDPKLVPIAPNDLVGFDFASVLRVLRRPDVVDNNTLSVVWTYSESACILQLFFYPDIETTKYHLLKFDLKDGKGERLIDGNVCMQRIAIMRNNE